MTSPSSRRPFRVGRSRTGLGLFATKPIKKGQFIIRYWGRRVPTKTADDLNSRYLFELNSRWTVDGATRRNIARYINHSCRPNAETDVKKGKILITAIKTIAPGEEITYNYGRDYFDMFLKPNCRCAACLDKKKGGRSPAKTAQKRTRKTHGVHKAATRPRPRTARP